MTLLGWFVELCRAVEFIHHSGYLHRDVKPKNVFFDQSGKIKLGDFGLVSEKPDGTQTTTVGTRLYVSPEQLSQRKYSKKTDVFPLGKYQ